MPSGYGRYVSKLTIKHELATTRRIAAYGGVQLDASVLVQLTDALREGSLPFDVNHDLRRPFPIQVIDAGVDELEDGEQGAWVTFEVEEEVWEARQRELKLLGAPGGFSFAYGIPLFVPAEGERPDIRISADAAHFLDLELLEAAMSLSEVAPTEADRLYQFSAVSIAKITLETAQYLWATMPAAVLAAVIVGAVGRLFRSRKDPTSKSVVEMVSLDGDSGRIVRAHVESSSDAVIIKAIESFQAIALQDGRFQFAETTEAWLPIEGDRPAEDRDVSQGDNGDDATSA
jgi:hypothetical protein